MLKPATKEAYQLIHDGTLALAQVEANGIRIDTDYLAKAIAITKERITTLTSEIKEDQVFKTWQRRYGKKTSLDSRPQLAEILFKELGHKSSETTPTGRMKADVDALETVKIPFVKKYVRLAKSKKLLSTYLYGVEREVVDGFLHPVFNLHTVLTYRGSSDSPNFQNIPIRDGEVAEIIRKAFVPRKGCRIVENDFKGVEVSVAAIYCKDPRLIAYVKDKNLDMHRDMAAELFMCKPGQVTKAMRFAAKSFFVFAQFYGDYYIHCADSLWHKAVKDKEIALEDGTQLRHWLKRKGIRRCGACDPDQEAMAGTFEAHVKAVERAFWGERFYVYSKWKKAWFAQYQEEGYFRTHTGFLSQGIFSRNQVTNAPIQGTAFHCLLWTLIRVQKELRKRKMRALIIGQIHDSLIADVPEEETDEYLAIVKHTVTVELPKAWTWLSVPLEIEAELTEVDGNWYDKKAVTI